MSHSGSFLVDLLAISFVLANPGAAVCWIGCTGRTQREVEDEIGKRGGSGLRFTDGSSVYIDVVGKLSESVLSPSSSGTTPSSILESTYKTIKSRVSPDSPCLIVVDSFSSLPPLFTHATSRGFMNYLNALTLTSNTSSLILCGADAHLNSLPSPHALTNVAGAISGELDTKWMGSGGIFGLATDENEASIRVLRDEENASSDPTSSGGDFSPTSKLHESLARQADIVFDLNALDSGFSREVHGKLTVEAKWGGRGFLNSQDANVKINWKDGDGGVKGVRV